MNPRAVRISPILVWCSCLALHCALQPHADAIGRKYYVRSSMACTTASCCSARLQECRAKVIQLESRILRLAGELRQCEQDKKHLAEKLSTTKRDRDRVQRELDVVSRELAETRHRLHHARERIESLKSDIDELKDELKDSNANLDRANEKLTVVEANLKSCQSQNENLEDELREANRDIAELRDRLNHRLAWFWALALLALFLLILLLICLWFARYRAWMLQRSIEDARQQRDRDLAELRELGNRYAGAKSRVIAYRRQLDDLHNANSHLHSLTNEYRTYRTVAEQRAAVAEERVVGVTRELAHKKDCCCCGSRKDPPVIVAHNNPSNNNPISTAPAPVGGASTAGGAASAAGAAGPAAKHRCKKKRRRPCPSDVDPPEIPSTPPATQPSQNDDPDPTDEEEDNEDEGVIPPEGILDEKSIDEGDTTVKGSVRIRELGGLLTLEVNTEVAKGGIGGTGKGVVEVQLLDQHLNPQNPMRVQKTVGRRVEDQLRGRDTVESNSMSIQVVADRFVGLVWAIAASDSVGFPTSMQDLKEFLNDEFGVSTDLGDILKTLEVGQIESTDKLSIVKLATVATAAGA